jgi:hypothetical protein
MGTGPVYRGFMSTGVSLQGDYVESCVSLQRAYRYRCQSTEGSWVQCQSTEGSWVECQPAEGPWVQVSVSLRKPRVYRYQITSTYTPLFVNVSFPHFSNSERFNRVYKYLSGRFIHPLRSLSCDRSVASSEASSPKSMILLKIFTCYKQKF